MDSVRAHTANKRILLLAHNWDYLPLMPYHVALHLSERGYNVSLVLPMEKLSPRCEVKHVNGNLSLYFCPTMLWGGLKKGSDPLELIYKMFFVGILKYDIIFAFDSRPTVILPAVFGKLIKRVPLIIDWTDWFGRGGTIEQRSGLLYRVFFERIETFFEEHFRRYGDSSMVICPALERRLRGLGYTNRIHFFPLGCNHAPEKRGDGIAIRRRLNVSPDRPLIGCVGSLFPSDADLLFRSFALVRNKMDAELILIGSNNFGGRYQIPPHTIVTGKVSGEDLTAYVGCCDLMVMPLKNNVANNGRWPSKLNDYLACGKPVVSTKISVVTELLSISEFGLAAEDTPDDFARKIFDLLSDKERLKSCGDNALRLASEYLSWPQLMDKLERFMLDTMEAYKEQG